MLNEIINKIISIDVNKNIAGGRFDKKIFKMFNKDINKKETSFLYDILKKYNIKYKESFNSDLNKLELEFDYRYLHFMHIYNYLLKNNYKNVSIKNTYIKIENHDSLNYDDLKNLFLQFTKENPNCKLKLNQYSEKNTKQVLYYKIVKL